MKLPLYPGIGHIGPIVVPIRFWVNHSIRLCAVGFLGAVLSTSAGAAEWSPKLAADYLDLREKQWSEWPVAKAPGGACVSCHTQVTYNLARPLLRKALGETEPTSFEKAIVEGLITRLRGQESMFAGLKKEPMHSQALNVEAALAVLLLENSSERRPEETRLAWSRLWSLKQLADPAQGPWTWFGLDLDPWESEHSGYFAATVVALAAGRATDSGPAEQTRELRSYLKRQFDHQPLHNRLMALWASARMEGILDESATSDLAQEVWRRQSPDGGWSASSLGPWMKHAAKPAAKGSDAYATALVTFTLQQAGAGCTDPRLDRAKNWLRSHQNPQTGAWSSVSMNKAYPAGSMQSGFMDDAASGFAVLALLDGGACTTRPSGTNTSKRQVH